MGGCGCGNEHTHTHTHTLCTYRRVAFRRTTPASVDACKTGVLVPETTSDFHATAGDGPYFIAGAQTEILGHFANDSGGGRSLR